MSGRHPQADTPPGRHLPDRQHWADTPYPPGQQPPAATAAYGTQPTGMPSSLITGRNQVVAKVMFLQVCVCPQGGGCLPQCMLRYHTPPGWRTPPRDQADPPGWRNHPPSPGPGRPPLDGEPPQDQADPPDGEPPLPPRKQTPAYGLRGAGTHPTGMHSC